MRMLSTLRCQPCLKVARESSHISPPCMRFKSCKSCGPDDFGSKDIRAGASLLDAPTAATRYVDGKEMARTGSGGTSSAVISARNGTDRAPRGARSFRSRDLLEERQDALAVLVGDRQRLHAELLLNLERLQTGGLRVHVGVDELADAAVTESISDFTKSVLFWTRFLIAPRSAADWLTVLIAATTCAIRPSSVV